VAPASIDRRPWQSSLVAVPGACSQRLGPGAALVRWTRPWGCWSRSRLVPTSWT